MNQVRWAALTLEQVGAAAAAGAVAVLPVGATEQHGPHLATGTDWILAEAVALAAAERTGDVVLPTLAYGCSLGHTAPGRGRCPSRRRRSPPSSSTWGAGSTPPASASSCS